MDETTSYLLQRVAVLRSQLKTEKTLPAPETLEALVADLERAIERARDEAAALTREKDSLSRQSLELERKNDLLLHQKEALDRQSQNLERQVKTLERHNTNLQRQNNQVERMNAALEEQRVALELDRRRYRNLFEFTPDAALITDTSGTILDANHAASGMLCAGMGELRGANLLNFVAPPHQQLFITLLTHLQHIIDIELCIQPPARAGVDVAVTLTTLENETGKPAFLYWVLHDITERRRASAALNASERRFRTIFNEASIGIFLLDPEGRVLRANRVIQQMLGYGEDELLSRPIESLAHPDDPPLHNVELMLQENQSGLFNIENRLRRRDGQFIWASISLSALRDEQGALTFLIGMAKDITAEKQAAGELSEMRRRLLESGEVERLRLAQELHDGPTQDVYSAVFVAETFHNGGEGTQGEQNIKEFQDMLRGVANTLRDIVGELRPPTIGNLGLERAIRSHAERVAEQHPGLEIKLHLTRDGQMLPPHTRLAFFRIYQQCMSNILRHARATQAVIAFHIDATGITLDIWDNGKGFVVPKKWVDLLREGHYGLAGIDERVHALGGALKVESRPGAGTLVHVTAPVGEV